MSGASRWLDATPRRTAPATRPAPSPTRTSSFLVMQAPFDDRFYGAREETDVRLSEALERRTRRLREGTETYDQHGDHRDRRVPIDSTRPAVGAGPGRRVRGSETSQANSHLACFLILSLSCRRFACRVESLGDLGASSANSAFPYVSA